MGLMKGGAPVQGQMQEQLTDEQKRDIERGMILLKIRRIIRIIALVIFAIYVVYGMFAFFANDGFIAVLLNAVLGGICAYVLMWIITMVGGGFCIKIYLYFRDLFTSSGTRL